MRLPGQPCTIFVSTSVRYRCGSTLLSLHVSISEAITPPNTMALIGMSGSKLGDTERDNLLETIAAESMRAVRPFLDGDALVCEMRSHIAVAR